MSDTSFFSISFFIMDSMCSVKMLGSNRSPFLFCFAGVSALQNSKQRYSCTGITTYTDYNENIKSMYINHTNKNGFSM